MNKATQPFQLEILEGIPDYLPDNVRSNADHHAPQRADVLSPEQKLLAIRNALRYFPEKFHEQLARDFMKELRLYGRIYMYRYRPKEPIFARPLSDYPAKCTEAAAIMLMIQNNLDPAVAQHPEELITYGGNGAVFQNWAQYRLTMKYLAEMNETQTLVMYSGHPLGLFPSSKSAPRLVVTNGMTIPNRSSRRDYEMGNAMGVTQYGQMTAGSYMYIGPQGIVHGTTITLLNATASGSPRLFVSSGLGGMSGAQPRAAKIAGIISLIAEVNPEAARKRHAQGWVDLLFDSLDEALERVQQCIRNKEILSIAWIGNVVELWEALLERDIRADIGSDQTSLHNPYSGGYYPAGIPFNEAREMLRNDPVTFKKEVQKSLVRQVKAINALSLRGMYFFDYGNAFLAEAEKAGAPARQRRNPSDSSDGEKMVYPSYVQDIMGPLCFDYGFGPFRWVCCSGLDSDLEASDRLAAEVIERRLGNESGIVRKQLESNLHWIKNAAANKLVVGSKARILYADAKGRREIASAFNQAIAKGIIKGPIVLGRDHHDVSGTDSPWRETSNIYDGSAFTADMAVQNFAGDAFRGATWVSLHNGGGVGWGEAINGGFGLVLDGSDDSEKRLSNLLPWDVNNGIARRAWARNSGAIEAAKRAMEQNPDIRITLPYLVDDSVLKNLQ